MGVIKFSPKDIFILYNEDDTYFVLLNNENLTTVDSNNNLVLKKTIKDTLF